MSPNVTSHFLSSHTIISALRKRSLLTQPGLDLTVDLFVRIGVVNQMSAYPILSAFNDLPKFTGMSSSYYGYGCGVRSCHVMGRGWRTGMCVCLVCAVVCVRAELSLGDG